MAVGRNTRNVVRPGWEPTSMRPLCSWTTMLWLMLRPSPVPLPGGLVVKNGSNTRAAVSGAIPCPSSSISTHYIAVLRRGANGDRSVRVDRCDRVLDDIGPHLVQLPAVRLDAGQGVSVVAVDHHAGLELATQHHQRVLQALGYVHLLDRALIQVGIRPHGADDLGDPPSPLTDLGQQVVGLAGPRHPRQE